MYERFTDRSRRVVVLAQEEARFLNHNCIGTEHILLGLIHEGEGVAAQALEQLGISLESVRTQVQGMIGRGGSSPSGHIPFTPRAKKVLELSLREALMLGHNFVGTEHILLGLIHQGEGVAAQVLVKLGADLSRVRQQVIQLLSSYVFDANDRSARGPTIGDPSEKVADYIDRLRQRAAEFGSQHREGVFKALYLSQKLNAVLVDELETALGRLRKLEEPEQEQEPEAATG